MKYKLSKGETNRMQSWVAIYRILRKEISILLKTFYLLLKGEFSYHAGALTYNFIMVTSSIIYILSIVALYTPLLSYERLVSILVQVFPQYTNEVVLGIAKLYEGKATFSLLSLGIAYFFSVSFIKNLYKAFLYVRSNVKTRSELSFWFFLPVVTLLFSIFSVAVIVLYTFVKFFKVSLRFEFLIGLFSFFSVLLIIYRYFLDSKMLRIVYVSLLISVILYSLNKTLTSIFVKFVTSNPLYGLLGSFLIFLVWLYVNFQMVLLGATIITYEERELK